VEKMGKKAVLQNERTVFSEVSGRAQISVQKHNFLKIFKLFFLEIF
jgi:hypothetical protein